MKVLFIAYHAASYPIMESQGFAYMRKLSKEGADYSLLTFETKNTVAESRQRISELGIPIKWKYLMYHRRPRFLATLLDIICGIFSTLSLSKKEKIVVIHARGFIPALIGFLPARLCGTKLFFDTRGLLADKYVGGGLLKQHSLTYKLMRFGEDYLLKKSDCFTVETYKHAEIIRSSKNGLSRKMDIIPCCVDINKFYHSSKSKNFDINEKFDLIYLGKAGTWYLIEEMLDFFSAMSIRIPNSRFVFLTQDEPEHVYSTAAKKGISISKIAVIKPGVREVPDFLSKARAGIFFINPHKRYNSSPIKYGEYLASGLPVIINSGIGDTEEITEEERVGVVVKKFSMLEYESAIERFIGLLGEGEPLSTRCRAAAEKHFSLNEGVKKYHDIYRKLST